jgi:hypothetical protein
MRYTLTRSADTIRQPDKQTELGSELSCVCPSSTLEEHQLVDLGWAWLESIWTLGASGKIGYVIGSIAVVDPGLRA